MAEGYGWMGARAWSPLNLPPALYGTVPSLDGIGRRDGYPRKKVAILGAGCARFSAPAEDATWEIWTCNCLVLADSKGRVRADRWFELHPLDVQTEKELAFMRACPVRLYTVEDYRAQGFPMSVRYPLEHVIEATGGQDYFSCTFAYQLAFAYAESFREIGLYGVCLPFGTRREQTVERACVEWWLGWLEGKGVRLHLMAEDGLALHPPNWTSTAPRPRYGINYWDEKQCIERLMASSSNL